MKSQRQFSSNSTEKPSSRKKNPNKTCMEEKPRFLFYFRYVSRYERQKTFPHLPLLGQAAANHSPQANLAMAGPLILRSHREGQDSWRPQSLRTHVSSRHPGRHFLPEAVVFIFTEILKILMCSNWMQNGNLLCLLILERVWSLRVDRLPCGKKQ